MTAPPPEGDTGNPRPVLTLICPAPAARQTGDTQATPLSSLEPGTAVPVLTPPSRPITGDVDYILVLL